MRVQRSLTIKQMAMVSTVAIAFIFVFIVIQLFYFVQQNRNDTLIRMENMAHSVRAPLAQAVLKADIPQAEEVLNRLEPAGILSRIDVVLPNQFQALGVTFVQQVPIPEAVTRIFKLPIEVSLPLYALGQSGHSQPLAYLVLQADSWPVYRFIISTLSILLTTYLLLTLILTVSISWSVNRLVVHPVRNIARDLDRLSPAEARHHQLYVSPRHQDDEIGMLVRSYNRNQQFQARAQGFTEVSGEPAFLAALSAYQQGALLIMISTPPPISCEALRNTQHYVQNLIWRKKIHQLTDSVLLGQLTHDTVGVFISEAKTSREAAHYAQQLLTHTETHPAILLRDTSIGIALLQPNMHASEAYHRAISAALIASYQGSNQIHHFEKPERVVPCREPETQNRQADVLPGGDFAIWLQPQVNMASGAVVGAEVLLRQQQPDENWCLPSGLIERIEDCGLMVTVGSWVMEESCRVLSAWQKCGIILPLSINLSAIQLMHKDMVSTLLRLLGHYQIKPKMLTIEITESRRIDDPQAAADILRPLHDAGVKIALDDFGMGYACLRDLHHMKSVPVDILKMDKSFIERLPEDDGMAQVIVMMANILGLEIVTEGVENTQQRDWLLAHGVTHAQGFLFGQAQPISVFESRYLRT